MIRLKPPIDSKDYKEIPQGLSDYERKKSSNTPTHFTMKLIEQGLNKGFDKVTYFRKIT